MFYILLLFFLLLKIYLVEQTKIEIRKFFTKTISLLQNRPINRLRLCLGKIFEKFQSSTLEKQLLKISILRYHIEEKNRRALHDTVLRNEKEKPSLD